ncbi:uncharacterized protein TNCV_4537311 [Trichonephila clavipes]|nr:uncharacterized protein TNCV_4537311 [Trichonephila clavipes]
MGLSRLLEEIRMDLVQPQWDMRSDLPNLNKTLKRSFTDTDYIKKSINPPKNGHCTVCPRIKDVKIICVCLQLENTLVINRPPETALKMSWTSKSSGSLLSQSEHKQILISTEFHQQPHENISRDCHYTFLDDSLATPYCLPNL